MEQLYWRGTILKFTAGELGLQYYILAECREKDAVFQIISITGYHAGNIYGYIAVQPEVGAKSAITLPFLKQQLKRNFLDIDWDTFEVDENI